MKIDVPQILMKVLYLLSSRYNIMNATQREQKYQIKCNNIVINRNIILIVNTTCHTSY